MLIHVQEVSETESRELRKKADSEKQGTFSKPNKPTL
jgi:hypothetical protein